MSPISNPSSNVDLGKVRKYEDSKDLPEPLKLEYKEKTIYTDASWADTCLTCGTCASACPIAGVDGLDPRKIVRMAVLGMDDELVDQSWPWKCTMCAKCENSCPANIEIMALMRRLRGLRQRSGSWAHPQGCRYLCLERGNNLGIPKDDFIFLCEELGEELAEEGLVRI